MNEIIRQFEQELLERLSRSYYDELLYFSGTAPNALINFNDVLLLKKGQKYIHHTELVFQKSIAHLFSTLFCSAGKQSSVCKTDGGKGRGVYVKHKRTRVHFLGQEKFVNFPRVPWFNFSESGDGTFDLYSVTVKKDEIGNAFVHKANELLKSKGVTTKGFIVLEDFVIECFGRDIWNELNETMGRIESASKNFQWFGLIHYYNQLTKENFLSKVATVLRTYDYRRELHYWHDPIGERYYETLKNEFVEKEKFRMLLSGEDFAKSFIASEWLFENLNNDDFVEKTYIVTGYIKSIEQLLFYMIAKSADAGDQIGILKRGEIVNVDINSPGFFMATLGNMTYYLNSYPSRHIYQDNLPQWLIRNIASIIYDWVKLERNGYFHKDNVYSAERVAEIRGRTFLLYFLIISAIKIQN